MNQDRGSRYVGSPRVTCLLRRASWTRSFYDPSIIVCHHYCYCIGGDRGRGTNARSDRRAGRNRDRLTLHAEGAQFYDCKAGADGKLAWAFREPIATLLLDGKTVGRHYAGPNWDHIDGSGVAGKVLANAPGKTANDPGSSSK